MRQGMRGQPHHTYLPTAVPISAAKMLERNLALVKKITGHAVNKYIHNMDGFEKHQVQMAEPTPPPMDDDDDDDASMKVCVSMSLWNNNIVAHCNNEYVASNEGVRLRIMDLMPHSRAAAPDMLLPSACCCHRHAAAIGMLLPPACCCHRHAAAFA